MVKRSILFLLVVSLLISFAPGTVLAQEEPPEENPSASTQGDSADEAVEAVAAESAETVSVKPQPIATKSSTSEFAGGAGTAEDPYLIETKYHLNNVRNHLSAHYQMIADIIFTATDFAEDGDFYNGGAGWQPIGSENSPFTGTFDGNCHVVEGLQISAATTSSSYLGLFGYAGSSTFKNLSMVDCSIGEGVYIGGFVGYASSDSTVIFENCHFGGIISSTQTQSLKPCVGGILGWADTEALYMTDCHSSGSITVESSPVASESHSYVGGLVGRSRANITLSNCYNTADIYAGLYADNEGYLSAYASIGGLVGAGSFNAISFTQCYNSGDIRAKTTAFRIGLSDVKLDRISPSAHAGGIIGFGSVTDRADISACYNTGNITAKAICTNNDYDGGTFAQAGGILGALSGSYSASVVHIKKCYNTGIIDADATHYRGGGPAHTFEAHAGGIAGGLDYQSTIEDCYNMGSVVSDSYSGYDFDALLCKTYAYSGGIVGTGSCDVSTCYNIGELSAYANQDGSTENTVAKVHGVMGTFSGLDSNRIENCYYSLTDTQMQQQETFVGFDFENVWTMRGYKYPQLRAFVKVDNVEFAPITVFENGLGDWNGDNFQYWWWENLSYAITYTDGSTYEGWGTCFEYQGEGCELVFSDTQEEAPWKAGNTYEATANFLGYEATVPVTVAESPVASVEVEPISLFENTYYYGESTCCWWDALNYTITFKDGSTYTGSGYCLEYEGQEYPVVQYDSQGESPWEAGNTYECKLNFLGYEATVPVTVLECPVASVEVEPISLIENTYCYGDNFCHWWDILSYTVTYKDGTAYTAVGEEFEYQGDPYYIQWSDTQEEAPWEAGNDYEITVNFLGYEVTVPVTVLESPVANVEFEPVTMFENNRGQWTEDFFEYYWWDSLTYTVTFHDGSTYTGSGYWLEYEGREYPVVQYDGQYETHWEVGNTYEATASFLGYEVTVPVTIEASPIVSVDIQPITIFENSCYDFNGSYNQYYWWYEFGYTVHYTKGNPYTGRGGIFKFWGNEYSIAFEDFQEETPWEVGNTYEVTVWFLDHEVTVPVTIAPCPVVAAEVEPITMVAYTGGEWYEDAYWYYWWNDISYTLTFADGTTYSNTNNGVEYDGWIYNYFYWDTQYDSAWEAGGTYENRLNFLGYDVTVPVTVVEPSYISSSSLTLDSTLQLNIFAELNGLAAEGHTLQLKIGEEVRQLTNFQVDGQCIVFTAPLSAHLLHQEVRLELMYDNQVVDVKTWTLDYYYYSLRWEHADDTALMTLLDALSDYAAYAQYFANPGTGVAPNVATVEAVTQKELAFYKPVILTSDNAGLGIAAALYLDDACDLKIKFNAANWAGHTLYINGQAVTPTQVDNKMVCKIGELLPQQWGNSYNIKVVNTAGNTVFEADYSVLSYVYICLGRDQEIQTGLHSLLKAMYLYSKAASDYQG